MSLIQAIDALLPQTQCGKCGHPGCLPYATSIAAGEAINKCPPGGDETIHDLAALLDQEPLPLDSPYPPTPLQVAFIREAECIGCTKCIKACPVDAIVGAAKLMHTVITAECTGCELCIAPCPVDCIDLTLLPIQPSREEQRQNAIHYRLRYEARNTRIALEEQRKKTEREARLSRAESIVHVGSPTDPVQAAIARVKAQKSDSVDLDATLKKLKINASMANVALKKAERQLVQRGTPQLEEQVASLRQAAEAAQHALDNAQKEASPSSPPQTANTNAELKRAKVAAAMARAQLSKAEKAFGPEPTAKQCEQLNGLRISADTAEKLLRSLESIVPALLEPMNTLKTAKLDVVQARAALLSAERNHVSEVDLAPLKETLIKAENTLRLAEAASNRPHPQPIKVQKTPVDPKIRALKTQIAYAKAEVSRLERSSDVAPEHLITARMHLSMLERQLSEDNLSS